MKPNRTGNCSGRPTRAETIPRQALPPEERRRQRHQDQDQDQEFIKAMNEFTAKAGLLSDDPYFGGL
ncbi:TPA: type II toxin-antitoxin system CcdA family antitoxin [Enterobacter cloacae]|nr:type II toxin-antitoxin system CcdA family antitoxin [Enterobacter cloacae]